MGLVKEWEAYGLRCRILDGPFGNYNGYVAVPKNHSAWEQDYDLLQIEVHGGLTFGKQGREDSDNWPDPELYWYGFDTAHAGDWVSYATEMGGRKWTIEDVIKETEDMAKQFSEMKRKVFLDYDARETIRKHYGEEFLDKLMNGDLRYPP